MSQYTDFPVNSISGSSDIVTRCLHHTIVGAINDRSRGPVASCIPCITPNCTDYGYVSILAVFVAVVERLSHRRAVTVDYFRCRPTSPGVRESRGTIRYDTRCYFNVRSKADTSQLNLPHGNDN